VSAGDKETKGVLPVRTPALHLAGIGILIALLRNGPEFVRIGLPEWNPVTFNTMAVSENAVLAVITLHDSAYAFM
jgi:hypothetical protein